MEFFEKNIVRDIPIEEQIENMADPHYGLKCSTCHKPVIVPECDGISISVHGRKLAKFGGCRKVKKGPFTDTVREVICEICEFN